MFFKCKIIPTGRNSWEFQKKKLCVFKDTWLYRIIYSYRIKMNHFYYECCNVGRDHFKFNCIWKITCWTWSYRFLWKRRTFSFKERSPCDLYLNIHICKKNLRLKKPTFTLEINVSQVFQFPWNQVALFFLNSGLSANSEYSGTTMKVQNTIASEWIM